MKLKLKKLIGTIWGVYCPNCGTKLDYRGYYQEKSYCPECEGL